MPTLKVSVPSATHRLTKLHPYHPQTKPVRVGRGAAKVVTSMGLIAWGTELARRWGWAPEDTREERPHCCVFCEKIGRERTHGNDGTFVHSDETLVVFRDWRPAARRHYLVCPRAHVTSASSLRGTDDAALARRMLELGKECIARDFPDDPRVETRFGYHIPPFNSVDHLHMHAFVLPFDPPWKERKYCTEQWARFAFKPAEVLCAELEAELEAEKENGKDKGDTDGDKTSRL